MIHKEEAQDTLVLDLIICQLIVTILIIGFLYAKASYNFYSTEQKAMQAMELAIQINDEKKVLEKRNNDLTTVITLQKDWYQNELKKRDKYENIIKDIDRTWNQPK